MNSNQRGELIVFEDSVALAEHGAQQFVALAQKAIQNHGKFSVALSGGSTPRKMYQLLAQSPYRDQVDWSNIHVFWGDERYVPPDDPDNCFYMVQEVLLAHVPITAANIYPIPTIGGTPEAAAQAYAATITAFFDGAVPTFDLVYLGMGPDGHTASLFPGQSDVTEPSEALAVAVHDAPKPPPTRISLTFKALNTAHNIRFLVAGADKADMLKQVLQGTLDVSQRPAQGIQPTNGKLTWLVDKMAAAQVS
ncbi:MAG: 6-phosphogluconolactonase [Chloroflexi bacterium AL-W]|nr:6-phosphogluconolactonase [Chloroflexi bacterium AL-N1]NOK67591.1 6-phosphogluconolactonase [Chloroflexi bacterium AL-N10]NOK75639.1 6-phosphogluconolactonase [Chloroflexi bacterium AL-N5]NOK82427.1 6-phosphogluconolactonase [Chloroflexi bacterium AL-W]